MGSDKGESSDNVALVALLVAILALTAAGAQLLQALFVTAEGYHRCQESVIGPWAGFTHRTWWWWSFRYETRFTTPAIFVREVKYDPPNSVLISRPTKHYILKLPDKSDIKRSRTTGFLGFFRRQNNHSKYPLELARTLRPRDDSVTSNGVSIKGDVSNASLDPKPAGLPFIEQRWNSLRSRVTNERRADRASDPDVSEDEDHSIINPDFVTWWALLKEIHEHEYRVLDISVGRWPLHSGQKAEVEAPASDIQSFPRRMRTTVQLVERSWSLLPSEIIKPFAQTTIGSLIVIAHRLGMKWKQFDVVEGALHAEGNGLTIYSPGIIRGLGILVEYRSNTQVLPEWTSYVPTDEVDMLACGILTPSWITTGNFERLELREDKNEEPMLPRALVVFGACESRESAIELYRARNEVSPPIFDTILDAAICLFQPFAPIESSSVDRIPWPYNSKAFSSGIFLSWEGRLTLLYRLEMVVSAARKKEQPSSPTRLETLLNKFKYLREKLATRFFKSGSTNLRLTRKQLLREMMDTRKIPEEHPLNYLREEVTWSENALEETDGEIPEARFHACASALLNQIRKASERTHQRMAKDPHNFCRASPFVEDIEEYSRNVQPLAQASDFTIELTHQFVDSGTTDLDFTPDSYVEHPAHWWTMVYRGICWSMSVDIDPRAFPTIPSSYYFSEMPVYIS